MSAISKQILRHAKVTHKLAMAATQSTLDHIDGAMQLTQDSDYLVILSTFQEEVVAYRARLDKALADVEAAQPEPRKRNAAPATA